MTLCFVNGAPASALVVSGKTSAGSLFYYILPK